MSPSLPRVPLSCRAAGYLSGRCDPQPVLRGAGEQGLLWIPSADRHRSDHDCSEFHGKTGRELTRSHCSCSDKYRVTLMKDLSLP